MGISTHVLDLAKGRPAPGIPVTLERRAGEGWREAGSGTTDRDGRVGALLPAGDDAQPGTYRLRFDVRAYFSAAGETSFYPVIEITFTAVAENPKYHVPLLLSPFGYTTYRGS
jgi:5-hydroxyisourate hydrolase